MRVPQIIETIKHKDIPADVKERAIKEVMEIAASRKKLPCRRWCFYATTSIGGAMTWTQTPSGYDFWEKIEKSDYLPEPRQGTFNFKGK
jgi:hypothetical protein